MGLPALRGRANFRRIISGGLRVSRRGIVVFWEYNGLEHNRFGIAVRKEVGKAVTRNRIRRWTREFLRHTGEGLIQGADVVILVTRDESTGSYLQFTDQLTHVFDLSHLISKDQPPARPGRDSGDTAESAGDADDPAD